MLDPFQLLTPEYWDQCTMPPALVHDGTVGGAAYHALAALQFQGQWTPTRKMHMARVLRRLAQLYLGKQVDMHTQLLDAAYYFMHGSLHLALDLAYGAVLQYTLAVPSDKCQEMLRHAAEQDDVELAQAAVGAVIDRADFNGTTPLMIAAKHRSANMVSWLRANGADPTLEDVFHENYLHYLATTNPVSPS